MYIVYWNSSCDIRRPVCANNTAALTYLEKCVGIFECQTIQVVAVDLPHSIAYLQKEARISKPTLYRLKPQ